MPSRDPSPLAQLARRMRGRPGVMLLPLRAFLGVTFVYAGLQKLADRHYLDAKAPQSVQSQLAIATRTSPVSGLAAAAAHHAVLLGLLIAFGELAVGLGTLLGLWTRVAAAGGLLLSASFFLMVSFHTHPYFYGADIAYVFAWTPLFVGGAGGVLAVDAVLRERSRRELGLAPIGRVPIEFATVRKLCGQFDGGRCAARNHGACAIDGCPVLERRPRLRRRDAEELDRRAFLGRARVAAVAAVGGMVLAGSTAAFARVLGGSSGSGSPTTVRLGGSTRPRSRASTSTTVAPTSTTGVGSDPSTVPPASAAPTASPSTAPPSTAPTTSPPPAGTAVGSASAVPVGRAALFDDPVTGEPAIVVHESSGAFAAHSAVCTHAGCTVQYAGNGVLVCPCHGAEYDAASGQVLRGPAQVALRAIAVTKGSDGKLYVSS